MISENKKVDSSRVLTVGEVAKGVEFLSRPYIFMRRKG